MATTVSTTVLRTVPLFAHFTEEQPWLPEADKELIMGRALCDWIDWKLTA